MTAPGAFGQSDRRPPLTVAVAGNPTGLEPAVELSNVGTRITYSLFDTLIRRDFLQAFERCDVIAGVKPEIPEAAAYFGVLASCEPLEKYKVRFTTRVPDVLLEQRLASWCAWIVNKRHYAALGLEGFARNPIGTGPFRFVRMSARDHITFAAFDDYWMGRPNARGVVFKEVPELAARIAGLVSGEFDIITNVPPDQLKVLGGYPDIEPRSVVLANSHLLTFDARGDLTSDKRIRKALSLAITTIQSMAACSSKGGRSRSMQIGRGRCLRRPATTASPLPIVRCRPITPTPSMRRR